MKKIKAIKMATGGLMSMPPYIAKAQSNLPDQEQTIQPYDVNTPMSARQGLASRILSPSRTRLKHGGEVKMNRMKFAGGKLSTEEIIEMNEIKKLEAMKESGLELTEEQEQKIEAYKAKENIDKQELALGGMVGVEKGKYDQRPDYIAYAEGDIVEKDMPVEDSESLLTPKGMEDEMSIDEESMTMDSEDDMTDEDLEGMDAIIDTSALSEEEEKILDDAVEMHPELEAIIPKLVATEFTSDGEVEGPGTGTSDSIPALLSDGEFVFTAKAVKNIGVDKLRKMMKQAEEAYDAGLSKQVENV